MAIICLILVPLIDAKKKWLPEQSGMKHGSKLNCPFITVTQNGKGPSVGFLCTMN